MIPIFVLIYAASFIFIMLAIILGFKHGKQDIEKKQQQIIMEPRPIIRFVKEMKYFKDNPEAKPNPEDDYQIYAHGIIKGYFPIEKIGYY